MGRTKQAWGRGHRLILQALPPLSCPTAPQVLTSGKFQQFDLREGRVTPVLLSQHPSSALPTSPPPQAQLTLEEHRFELICFNTQVALLCMCGFR